MLGQMKDLWNMQKQAKQMQKQVEEMKVIGETKKGKVKVHLNGLYKIEHITIDPELMKEGNGEKLGKLIVKACQDGYKKIEKQMAKSMDMDQLKNMLGR